MQGWALSSALREAFASLPGVLHYSLGQGLAHTAPAKRPGHGEVGLLLPSPAK